MKGIACFVLFTALACAISFELVPWVPFCLTDDLPQGTMVKGEFRIRSNSKGLALTVEVKSPGRDIIASIEKDEGVFNFVSDMEGGFEYCFVDKVVGGYEPNRKNRMVTLQITDGPDILSIPNIAKKSHLTQLEADTQRAKEYARTVVEELHSLMVHDKEHSEIVEANSSWVSFLGFSSSIIICILSTWQMFYLKRYFHQKKVI